MKKVNKNKEKIIIDMKSLPAPIRSRFMGYTAAAVIFVLMGIVSWILTRSALSGVLGVVLAGVILGMRFYHKQRIIKKGFEIWGFHVIEHTYLTRVNRKPTGINAEALDGPYKGEVFSIPLTSQTPAPLENSFIDVCVPADVTASRMNGRMYLSECHGFSLVED